MSYSTVIHIWPGEKIEDGEELRNGHGTGSVCWDAIAKEYISPNFSIYLDSEKLWPIWKDQNVPEHVRAALMLTYDRAYVLKKDYGRMAEDLKKFNADFPMHDKMNHWPKLEELFKSDPDIPAIGLYCTSIGDNPFEGEFNEEKDEYDPPNWGDCYDFYSELDSLKEGAQSEN